ncbi:hypothetical protein IC617_07815 [Neiella sp. HB171785]|uniref:Uncharacterized protein n=1 Tax=Neiella litorisoli TaxID=2771431 RepID=A0A8J6UIW8_9GAMM|nr:hypothetical protein [Neiella litorisoli]MBD1389328.1 hypothetical protein [Neiella litorisoli]
MKTKLFAIIMALLFAPQAWSLPELNQATLQSVLDLMADMNQLAEQHPEWDSEESQADFFADDGSGFIAHLKRVGAYDSVNKIAVKHGFDDIQQGFGTFRRAALAGMSLQFEAVGMDFAEFQQSLKQRLDMMKQNGASAEMLAEQEAQLAEFGAIATALEQVPAADKEQMMQHIQWFFSQLEAAGLAGDLGQ